ncbi:MAG: RluA family pseudouridine synthase [Magnetococcales bacterium]|nr:RluA family pseudouridine synthase [Magnetococcales bacterium]
MEAKPVEEKAAEKLPVRHARVNREEAGMRLDRFLADRNAGAPMALIQRWLRTGQTRVNGARAKGGYRLTEGEEIRVPPYQPAVPETGNKVPEWAVREVAKRILWRDERVLVLDKPHGVPVHGGSGLEWGSVDAVRAWMRGEGGDATPELCHRLDKETSGCLLFGLDKMAVRRLTEAFRQGRVEKGYLVLVKGIPRADAGVIDRPLVKGEARGGERMVIAGETVGESARTRYRVLERFRDLALLSAHPETGRTHQIRVHLQWLGHPVAGDEKYGDFLLNRQLRKLGLTRMFLHARHIVFPHPESGKDQAVEAPLDGILTGVLAQLALRNG